MGLFSDVEGNLQEELAEISKKYIPRDCMERVCIVGKRQIENHQRDIFTSSRMLNHFFKMHRTKKNDKKCTC